MKLNDLMVNSTSKLLDDCVVTNIKYCSDDLGEVQKIIVEYVPTNLIHDASNKGSNQKKPNVLFRGGE